MSAIDHEPFPRGALIATAAMLGVTLAGVAAVRIARLSGPVAPVTAPAATTAVELRFADASDGSIKVSDARSGAQVATVAPGTGGFVRGVMRGMARDRLARHIGEQPPFRLSRDGAGQLWLQDTATGRLIDLEAFGSGNRAAFAAFLPGKTSSPGKISTGEART